LLYALIGHFVFYNKKGVTKLTISKRQEKKRKREEVDKLAGDLRVLVACKLGLRLEEGSIIPLCDCCGRFPGEDKENENGYCHIRETSEFPKKGHCDGLLPPEGITIVDGLMRFGPAFLEKLGLSEPTTEVS